MKYKVKAYLDESLGCSPIEITVADEDDVAKQYALEIANDFAQRGIYSRVLVDGYIDDKLVPEARISVYN